MVGTELGHYRIVRALGSGGMGEVYAAEDSSLHRLVALKILPAALASDPDRRDRFAREAQAIAALNHPNIVTIHSIEHIGGAHFLTMELVEGKTLADLIAAHAVPLERVLGIAVPLAGAISAAHERGIVHRDLKPANVMTADDGRVKVLDFGLAKLRDVSMTGGHGVGAHPRADRRRAHRRIGFVHVARAGGRPHGRLSVGHLFAGHHPVRDGDRTAAVHGRLEPVRALVDHEGHACARTLPRDFGRIVRHCLQKDPELRYQSAKDLRSDLQQLADDLHSGELQAAAPAARPPSRHAAAWRVGAASIAIAVAVAGAMLWRARGGVSPITPAPAASFAQLTTAASIEGIPSLSPDGRWVVYQGNST